MKCFQLSPSLLLEYDELPPKEIAEDFYDWKNDNVKEARLNGEKVWLFSACNIPNLIEYIIQSNASFAQFGNLRDILYPDIDLQMWYSDMGDYSDIHGWMKSLIDYLIEKNEIVAFGRADGLALDKLNFPDDDELIFAVKSCLSLIDQNIADAIIFPELSECEKYCVAFDSDKASHEECIIYDMGLEAAIAAAISIPESLFQSLKFFSLPPVNDNFCIIVENNSNSVVEIQVSPALEVSYWHHYDIEAYISKEALIPEIRYVLEKRASNWPFLQIKVHS